MGRLQKKGRSLATALVLALALVACSGQAPTVASPTVAPTGAPSPTIVPTGAPTPTIGPTEGTAPTLAPTSAPVPSLTPTITVAPQPTLAPTPTSTVTPQESVPVIPRQVLFGNPGKAAARLSSDGNWLSYLAPVDGVLNVWVAPADSPEEAKPVTEDKIRGVRAYFWAFTNEHIIYIQDKEGDENWRVYRVDLNTNETRDLTPLEDVPARVQGVSSQFPDEIIIGLNDRNPQLHDLFRVSIRSGEKELIQENPGFSSFLTDDDVNVQFAFRVTPDGLSLTSWTMVQSTIISTTARAKKRSSGLPTVKPWRTLLWPRCTRW